MEINVKFPGGKKVDAVFSADLGGAVIHTDQPVEAGGEGTAPAPFDLFLASLATCAGIFALSFCNRRNLNTEGLSVRQKMEYDEEKHLFTKVSIEITPPKDFPDKYKEALVAAASQCTVKRHLHTPPEFDVSLSV